MNAAEIIGTTVHAIMVIPLAIICCLVAIQLYKETFPKKRRKK